MDMGQGFLFFKQGASHFYSILGKKWFNVSDARQEKIKYCSILNVTQSLASGENSFLPSDQIKLQTEHTLKANFIVSRVFAGLHTTDKAITYSLMSMQLSSCWNKTQEK